MANDGNYHKWTLRRHDVHEGREFVKWAGIRWSLIIRGRNIGMGARDAQSRGAGEFWMVVSGYQRVDTAAGARHAKNALRAGIAL